MSDFEELKEKARRIPEVREFLARYSNVNIFDEMDMRIYIVERQHGADYDEYDSVVVKAKSEELALKHAVGFYDYFGENEVTVTEIHLDDNEGIIHTSFKAG